VASKNCKVFSHARDPNQTSVATIFRRMFKHTQGQPETLVSVILLMGLPGAGKSSFAKTLWRLGYTVINPETMEDDSGNNFKCREIILSVHAQNYSKRRPTLLVVDQTNMSSQVRWKWLEAIHRLEDGSYCACLHKNVACVYLDTVSKEVCADRAFNRTDHPTIRPERDSAYSLASVQAIVDGFQEWIALVNRLKKMVREDSSCIDGAMLEVVDRIWMKGGDLPSCITDLKIGGAEWTQTDRTLGWLGWTWQNVSLAKIGLEGQESIKLWANDSWPAELPRVGDGFKSAKFKFVWHLESPEALDAWKYHFRIALHDSLALQG